MFFMNTVFFRFIRSTILFPASIKSFDIVSALLIVLKKRTMLSTKRSREQLRRYNITLSYPLSNEVTRSRENRQGGRQMGAQENQHRLHFATGPYLRD
ncbi:hypothetical protein RB195_023903 [Necator americanus]|uniref:Secreted protein n=1 Tax=Necator americanus TaxID=51031 RepID=A0ABR1ENF3_NECAM